MKSNNEFSLRLNVKVGYENNPFSGGTSIDLPNATLYLNSHCIFSEASCEHEKIVLIGCLYNRAFLSNLASQWESQAHLLNDAELILSLKHRFDWKAYSIAEGNFCIVVYSGKRPVQVVTAPRGYNAVHAVSSHNTWVTNTLKSVSVADGVDALRFCSEVQLISSSGRPETFSAVQNAQRLKPGTLYTLNLDSQGYEKFDARSLHTMPSDDPVKINSTALTELIDNYLNAPLDEIAVNSASVGIPLSGGLDSSLIASLACGRFQNVKTYSIGTTACNEFEFAQLVAETLGTQHQTKVLSEDDVIRGIIESIYYNEIFDGLSAEIQSGLFNVYRLARGQVSTLLTGYGSDLLFGGILTPGKHYSDPNKLLSEQVYRTRWTGEFSTNGAGHYGLDIRHPFWNESLITLCHSLDPGHKTRNNEVKNILREYASAFTCLPDSTVWRKKIGIHEGSAVNHTFADILGSDTANYAIKNLFTYRVYKTLLRNESTPEELTHEKLRQIMQEEKEW